MNRLRGRALLICCGLIAPLFTLALESRAAPPAQAGLPIVSASTAICHQPEPAQNACYVSWQYMDAASDSTYSSDLIAITLTLNSRVRAYYAGFFQNVAYIIDSQAPSPQLKVACGPRGADGWGNTYLWRVSARNSNGLSSYIEDSVRCPGAILEFLPNIRR